jgi:hypothetical protein
LFLRVRRQHPLWSCPNADIQIPTGIRQDGQSAASFKAEHESLVTHRLALQPRVGARRVLVPATTATITTPSACIAAAGVTMRVTIGVMRVMSMV